MHTATISPPIYAGIRIVNRPDLENVHRLDRAAMPMISVMERNGMKIDPDRLRRLRVVCTDEMETLAAKVEELSGKRINIASGDQLADLLFTHLKLKQNGREKWTKSRERLSTDADVLKAMVSQHLCIKPILDWKEREKIRSTYTDSLIAQADEGWRIHTDISSISTDTGRLASSDPNLQNIPTRTTLGKLVRDAFIPEPGMALGTVDASQIEMRMNAFDSQCTAMMGFFQRKEDFYWGTAELMYRRTFPSELRKCGCAHDDDGKVKHVQGCPTVIDAPGEVFHGMTYKKWYRDICAKITALMVGYDASPGGLYDQFLAWGVPGWTEELCAKAIIDYFKAYPELLARKKVHVKRAMRYGFVWDLGGRVRWIPQMKSVHKGVVNEGMRQAGNLAGQGGAAFIIKLWMAIIWGEIGPYYQRHGLKFLMQIHDELLVEGPRQVVEDALNDFLVIMRTMLSGFEPWFNVSLDGSVAVGDVGGSWASLDK